jgi:thioredoxin-dependent peroxiredoxin
VTLARSVTGWARVARAPVLAAALGASFACRAGDEVRADPSGATEPAPSTPGALAPDFSALSHIGYTVSLASLTLERPVALYFCDVLNDSRCAALADTLRDGWLRLNQRLAMLLFITPHTSFANAAHASAHELPFLILSDRDHDIARDFGLGGDAVSSPRGYLIGPGRAILATFDELDPSRHLGELEQHLAAP